MTDALGRTVGLTITSGNLVQTYQNDPYGETTEQNPSFTNPYQYTGRENDDNGLNDGSKLYYYRARYYNPLMKRFMAEDQLGFGGGTLNL